MIQTITLYIHNYKCDICKGAFKNGIYHKVTSSTSWDVPANSNICDTCLEKYGPKKT